MTYTPLRHTALLRRAKIAQRVRRARAWNSHPAVINNPAAVGHCQSTRCPLTHDHAWHASGYTAR
jgi:hypothetical protein